MPRCPPLTWLPFLHPLRDGTSHTTQRTGAEATRFLPRASAIHVPCKGLRRTLRNPCLTRPYVPHYVRDKGGSRAISQGTTKDTAQSVPRISMPLTPCAGQGTIRRDPSFVRLCLSRRVILPLCALYLRDKEGYCVIHHLPGSTSNPTRGTREDTVQSFHRTAVT